MNTAKTHTLYLVRIFQLLTLFCLFPSPIVAQQWINVLDPTQKTSADAASLSTGELKTIPDLVVISSSSRSNKKKLKLSYTLHSLLEDTIEKTGDTYNTLYIPGSGFHFEVGQPDLPAKSIFVEIPDNHNFKVTTNKSQQTLLTNMTVLPVQPLPKDNGEIEALPFEKDGDLYGKNMLFPQDNIVATKEMTVRGHKILEIILSPLQYNPATQTLHMSPSLDVEIELTPKPEASSSSYENALTRYMYSDEFIRGVYSFTPPKRPTNPQTKTQSTPPTAQLEKYLILSNQQFAENATLKEFILWKKQKGYEVTLITTAKINELMGSADTLKNCISYMRKLSAKQYPNYLLVIGDEKDVTGVPGTYIKTQAGGYSDLPLVSRDTNDFIPDLFYGRLPASTNQELSIMLQKILLMEKQPPVAKEMYDKVLIAGQMQDNDPKDNRADRLFCETADGVASYFENNRNFSYGTTRVIDNPHNVTVSGRWNEKGILWSGEMVGERVMEQFASQPQSSSLITRAFNNGLSLVQYRAHGSPSGWEIPKWGSNEVKLLNNGKKMPTVFSTTCLTGAYHTKNNFTKNLLTHPQGGAYAVISSVDVSYSWTNDYLVHGLYSAFLKDYISSQNNSRSPKWTKPLPKTSLFTQGGAKRLGAILHSGLLYLYEHYNIDKRTLNTFQLYHLFGDPESFIRLHAPREFSEPTFPKSLSISENAVTLQLDNLEKGTLVSIYAEGEGLNIHQAQRAESEKVSFTISPKSKGILYVTLSKYNRIPFQQQINITGKTNASFTSNQDGIESNGTQPTPVINEEFVQTMEESPVQHPRQNNPSRTSSQPTERDGEYKSAF